MGLEVLLAVEEIDLDALVARLAEEGVPAMVVMIDGAFLRPGQRPPPTWQDARLRTPAGTVTLARRPGGVAVVVFGNADEALRAAQEKVAQALQPRAG